MPPRRGLDALFASDETISQPREGYVTCTFVMLRYFSPSRTVNWASTWTPLKELVPVLKSSDRGTGLQATSLRSGAKFQSGFCLAMWAAIPPRPSQHRCLRLSAAQAWGGVMKRFSTPRLKFRSAKGFRRQVVGKVNSRSAGLHLFLMLASVEDCSAISITSQH